MSCSTVPFGGREHRISSGNVAKEEPVGYPRSMIANRELDEAPHPLQVQILRKMSEADRVAMWNDLTRTTLEMSYLNLQQTYPEATPRELKHRFAALLYGETLANQAFGDEE